MSLQFVDYEREEKRGCKWCTDITGNSYNICYCCWMMVMRHDLAICYTNGGTGRVGCSLCELSQWCRTDSEANDNHKYSFYTRLVASREQNFHIFPAVPIVDLPKKKPAATVGNNNRSSRAVVGNVKKRPIAREKTVAKSAVPSAVPVKPNSFRVLEFPIPIPIPIIPTIRVVEPIAPTGLQKVEKVHKVQQKASSKSVTDAELDDDYDDDFVESKKVVGTKKPPPKKSKDKENKKEKTLARSEEPISRKPNFSSKKSVDEDDFVPIPVVEEKKVKQSQAKKRKSAPAQTPASAPSSMISAPVPAEVVVKKEVVDLNSDAAADDDDVTIVKSKNNKRRRRIVDDED